jgi:hypothetical protein
MSMLHGLPTLYPERNPVYSYTLSPDTDGCLRFTHVFDEESEYTILLEQENKKPLPLYVYALEHDMKGRYPYRGDLHMHTFRSDGDQDPGIVAADYRRHGYDFTVISDHHRYYPSLEAIDAFKDAPNEMNIVIGEEVHLPDLQPDHINDIHIVNFGGKYSVNAILKDEHTEEFGNDIEKRRFEGFPCPDQLDEDGYRAEVDALIPTLDIPEGIEPFTYASCVWVFNHIRKAEGLGIFCHPYWLSNVHQVPENITDAQIESLEAALEYPVKELGEYILPEFIYRPCAPWRVLAITFTNKAANEIKARLAAAFDDAEVANEIWAGTFHSICMRILRANAELAGYKREFTIYDTDDSKKAVSAAMKELNIDEKTLPVKTVMIFPGWISRLYPLIRGG